MISDITLGQFFPGSSILHRLDPRTKLLLSLLYIIGVFLLNTPMAFILYTLITLSLILASRISMRVILKGIKPIVIVLIFTMIINILLTSGEGEPLFSFLIFAVYKEGIIRAFFMAYRVIMLIVGSSVLLTYTTSPIALTDGLESLLSPLKLIKVPVHLFAMMMTIALRFIPTLIEETETIMNAQKSRGANFTEGSIIKRARALIPILVPLFVSSFKRAEELAVAMECRCYRGDVGRTKMNKLKYRLRDILWLTVGALLFAGLILLSVKSAELSALGEAMRILFYKI
ncbi:MAG: energy-coupling factor transporter transmembrane protein EcfT [Clostridia bacterium]|nr:energy-coupling factor transporter transmembrane protein EcfT [Clostridia bacterium]